MRYLTIALAKGRLANKSMKLFEEMGITLEEMKDPNTRKLIFTNEEHGLRFFLAKGPDVPTYVEYAAADIGIVGKDTILEEQRKLLEVMDLGFGKCRMCVAAKSNWRDDTRRQLRVATKFSNIAQNYYRSKGRDIDIIHLNGSIEIAPILGLSDVIVDIVETGTTLKENDLLVYETIVPISARLIANKSSYKFKGDAIDKILRSMAAQMEESK
jgi:ATP phosphoribosyltransferase